MCAWADAEGLAHVDWLTQSHNAQARLLDDRIGVATPLRRDDRR